jgi:spermidine/putrescine transport system substrate-binding protein
MSGAPPAAARRQSRRTFLAGCLLAACGRGARGAGGARRRALRISNWPLYIDGATVADFERATGIPTEYTEDVNDNAEFLARISEPLRRGQRIDRDIVVLTDWAAARLIRLGFVAPLMEASFPNKVNLVNELRSVDFDPGRRYTVPWMSGMTGIGYNPGRTGRELTSIEDLFHPALKGQVTMLTEMRDTLGLVMLGMGRDPATCSRADVAGAAARVKQARESGQIRKFTGNDYAEDLSAGNIAAAFAWSGDMQGLAADNPQLRWVAPKEGAILFSDDMMIPRTSDRAELAMAWMNYVYDPAHSAQIVAGAPYVSPVKGAPTALAAIAPELARSPLVNPPPELRARLHSFRTLSDAEDLEFNRMFQDAIGA